MKLEMKEQKSERSCDGSATCHLWMEEEADASKVSCRATGICEINHHIYSTQVKIIIEYFTCLEDRIAKINIVVMINN